MSLSIEEITLLGFSPGSVSTLIEAAHLQYGTSSFRIIMNTDVKMSEVPFIHPDFMYHIEHIDQVKYSSQDKTAVHFGVNHAHIRPLIFRDFKEKFGIGMSDFVNIIHPSSQISITSRIDQGFYLGALSVISAFASIGFGVSVKRSCSIGHHCKLGDYVCINPGVTISGFVEVGEGTEIGSGSTIIHNVSIGKHSMIGAGSVVTKDIPDGAVAYGNPCKVIRKNERWENSH